MQQRFTQALVGLRAAQRLLDANGAAFIGVNLSGTRAEFDAITARLGTLADAQETHRMGASGGLSSEQALARELRRKHMRPLVRVARSKVPAAAQLTAVSLPRIRSNSTDTASRARAMAAAVEPYKQLLHEAGLAADFSEQMVAAANELDGAVNVKKDHQFDRVGSTANIDSEVTEARLQLTTIDALVRAAVPENEDEIGRAHV